MVIFEGEVAGAGHAVGMTYTVRIYDNDPQCPNPVLHRTVHSLLQELKQLLPKATAVWRVVVPSRSVIIACEREPDVL